MRLYSQREAAAILGRDRRGLQRVLARAREQGRAIPGLTSSGLTDATLDWLRNRPAGQWYRDQHEQPRITGLTAAARTAKPADLWDAAIAHQAKCAAKVEARYSQRVEINDDKPVLVVLLSDLHFGNAHTDYAQAKADAELVRDTPGVYGAILGDLVDCWITPKLQHIQREQAMPLSDEFALMDAWIRMLRDKLLVAVSGNHDLRTYDMAGIDIIQRALGDAEVLYDQYEARFTLALGSAEWRWKCRHKWKGSSKLNSSYAMENDAVFNDGTWDIGVGGHTHYPTVFRQFFDHAHDEKLKLAIQLGSYSLDSSYGRKIGTSRIRTGGSAGLMFWPDGSYQAWQSLPQAVQYLRYLRGRK